MSEPDTEPLRPRVGDVLGAKYRVVRLIGEGGMGEVYEAHHLQLNERVALKMLRGTLAASDEVRIRFLREAQATAKIRNEHVATVFDVGELPGGIPYIVMELLEGHDLGRYGAGQPRRPAHEIVDYVLQACEALAEAHTKGIVHRDLKPSNLFLTTRSDGSPCIKVLDFGVSKLAEIDDGLTGTNESLGTVRYMSPEQLQSSRDVDGRSDIWSLGVVLFELLTHELPFVSDGGSLALAIVGKQPRPLGVLRPDLPQGLVEIALRCLEKDRARRFSSISELATALAPFGTDEARRSSERILRIAGAPSRPAIAAQAALATNARPPNTAPGWGMARRGGVETRYGLVLAAGVLGALVMLGIVVGLRAHAGRTTLPAASSQVAASSVPEAFSASASGGESAVPPTPPATSSAPVITVPSASSVPVPRPARPPPKPRPTATVADDRHG